ncbi:MAG: ribbon-helix-helix protein, CopG family [Acidobacteria bacterium]|nr:ribbon-helix-helix protein, CopG family [Acidobacteriota bacterium]
MARVNVFLGDDLLRAIDEEAEQTGKNRSALIQAALSDFLAARQKEREGEERQRKIEEACREMDKLAEKLGDWDPVAIIRGFRDSGWRRPA